MLSPVVCTYAICVCVCLLHNLGCKGRVSLGGFAHDSVCVLHMQLADYMGGSFVLSVNRCVRDWLILCSMCLGVGGVHIA